MHTVSCSDFDMFISYLRQETKLMSQRLPDNNFFKQHSSALPLGQTYCNLAEMFNALTRVVQRTVAQIIAQVQTGPAIGVNEFHRNI